MKTQTKTVSKAASILIVLSQPFFANAVPFSNETDITDESNYRY